MMFRHRRSASRRHSWVLSAAAIGGAGLLAAACGNAGTSASPSSPSPSSSGSGTTTALLNPPVMLGSLIPLTGTGLNYPYYLAGVEAAIRGLNASGGIKGHRVVLDQCDDQNDPNQAGTCARKMVSDHVLAVVASESLFGSTISPILSKAGIPQFVNALSPAELTTPGVFPIGSGQLASEIGNIMVAKEQGVKNIGVVVAGGTTAAEALLIVKKAAAAEGVNVVYSASIPATATDLSSFAESAIQSKAQIIMAPLIESQEIDFLQASQQLGATYRIGYAAVGLTASDFKSLQGNPVLNNSLFGGSVPPSNAPQSLYPALKPYLSDMSLEAASGDSYAAPNVTNNGTELMWFSAYLGGLVANAVPGSGVPTSAALLQYLNTAKNIVTGLGPDWTPSQAGPTPYNRVSQPYDYDLEYKNGNLVLVNQNAINIFTGAGLKS